MVHTHGVGGSNPSLAIFFDVIGNCCSVVVVKQEFVSQATALGARMCMAHSLIFVAEMLIFQGFRYFC